MHDAVARQPGQMSRATCLIMHDAVLNNPPRTLIRALSTCVTGRPGVWSRACTYVKINLQAPLKKKTAGDLTALTSLSLTSPSIC